MSDIDPMDVDDDVSSEVGNALNHAAQEKDLEAQFPNRPRNKNKSLPFHSLFEDLFNPLNEAKKPAGPSISLRKLGPKARNSQNPQEKKRAIIERFISRWRREVGDDIFPAFRLIVPDKDRDRAMYGLKEKTIGRLLVKIMKIDKNSEDGFNLLNWKLPGQNSAARLAGDFAGRCFEVISKRPFRVDVGDMSIDEVNEQLDHLAQEAKEEKQLPILTDFYQRMNAEELMWLIRIILKQMKVGATERTFFGLWHPDAESLFNVSSSLRRVCWDLYNPSIRLEGEDRGVSLMQCFQPQLAQFQMHDFKKIVDKLRPTEDDREFWIEEKLDGERMQLHMISDDSVVGGRAFKFWSRKAKDYTYLYGESLHDKNGSLTQHLKDAFHDGVENIILDGEMITWDPEIDKPCAFGTLKTAALSEQKNPFAGKERPLLRIFDILLLNDKPLTQYTLRDRRKALEASVKNVHRRLEVHEYKAGTKPDDIEAELREMISKASEGLVVKSPRSAYHLNDRNDDWIKVKPEYMMDFGENLDVLIIGGYYGSGKRGGGLSSFLCGLRNDQANQKSTTKKKSQFLSFCKVGGGLTANDYATIRHLTDGKWIDWDSKKPPTEYIELAGGPTIQREKPDVWIKPEDSIVIEAKAASVAQSDEFATNLTLRFPRFKRLRQDKDSNSALSMQEFLDLKTNAEAKQEQKKMQIDDERRKRRKLNRGKKPLVVAGYAAKDVNGLNIKSAASDTTQPVNVFNNLTFYIMTESTKPYKKTKPELEDLVKQHGGKITQQPPPQSTPPHNTKSKSKTQTQDQTPPEPPSGEATYCIASRRTVKVAALQKRGDQLIITPTWLFDCISQAKSDISRGLPPRTLVWEVDRHLYFIPDVQQDMYDENVDEFGDAYFRDTSVDELREVMRKMDMAVIETVPEEGVDELIRRDLLSPGSEDIEKGWLFRGLTFYFLTDNHDEQHENDVTPPSPSTSKPEDMQLQLLKARNTALFANAHVAESLDNDNITHIIIPEDMTSESDPVKAVRKRLSSSKRKLPRMVTTKWIDECWSEGTLVNEEKFAV